MGSSRRYLHYEGPTPRGMGALTKYAEIKERDTSNGRIGLGA